MKYIPKATRLAKHAAKVSQRKNNMKKNIPDPEVRQDGFIIISLIQSYELIGFGFIACND